MSLSLREELATFTGTRGYVKSSFGRLRLTEGIHYLRKTTECYWLIDIVESWYPFLKSRPFQVWRIVVNDDRSAEVTCREYSRDYFIVRQAIHYTSFPMRDFSFFLKDNVVMLRSEY